MIALLWLAGCGDREVTLEDCADVLPTEIMASTDFERSLVEPLLAGIREGVRPWDAEGIGVCQGARTCEAYLGADPGELAPGEYLVRANLLVPDVGAPGTWTVRFDTVCTPEGGESVAYNRTYEVLRPGGDRPFRIGALRRITSPSPGGAQTCTYTLTSPHPDGDRVFTGGWSTP